MKKNRFFLLLTLALMWANGFSAELLTGYVMLDGKKIDAEYTKLTNSTVALGSGFNACIPQYSEGRLHVPSTVTIGGTTYNVTQVSNLAFRLCSKLTFINFEENITRIGDFACVGCKSLTEIELPSSLQSIGSGAFIDLPLRSVVCTGSTPPRWEYNDVFHFIEDGIGSQKPYEIGSSMDLSVPEDFVESYQSAFYSDASLGWTKPVGWGSFHDVNSDYLEDFRIYSWQDLEFLRDLLAETTYPEIKKITLEADVKMYERPEWTYGISRYVNNAFQGTFDGQNHTISGLRVISEDESYVGLFSFFGGSSLKNLRLKDCVFQGKIGTGAIAGYVQQTTLIDNVYIDDISVSGKYKVGGLIGLTSPSGANDIQVQHCVVAPSCSIGWKEGYDTNTDFSVGGLIGFALNANIRYCAVLADVSRYDHLGVTSGPFIGTGKHQNFPAGSYYSTIDRSYYAGVQFDDYEPTIEDDGIDMKGTCVVAYRTQFLSPFVHTFGSLGTFGHFVGISNMKTFFMVPKLGLEHWCYKMGEYPLPVTMEYFWPVEVNVFTLRPQNCETDRVNGLSLLDEVPELGWYTFQRTEGEDRAFYFHNFKTSRLWFDESLKQNILNFPDMLPLGLGTITSTDGIEYKRELRAKDIGVKYIDIPQYKWDEEKQEFVLDDDGYPIETGEFERMETDERDFSPVGYSVYLPYNLKIPSFTKVYQPHQVKTEGDVTTVAFKEIDGDEIKAFTPYYVVVERDTVSLSTEAEAVCPPVTTGVVDLGTFEFIGTNQHLDYYESAGMRFYILQSDGKWHKVTLESPKTIYIPAFRSFFHAKSESSAKSIDMVFGDMETTDIDQIKTIDRDGTERYFDLNGRLLNGKPTQQGIYIKNGKKIVIK